MDRQIENELVLLRARKKRLAHELKHLDAELGRVAARALDSSEYVTKSSIGRLIGVSHTHVGNLIDAARQAPHSADPRLDETSIAVMDNSRAADYVLESGGRIERSISAFESSDALFQSGLDPRLFADEGDVRPDVPSMLWHLDTGEWIGVSTTSVGYGGTGPSLASEALVRAGLSEGTARDIVRWRFCDARDVDDPKSWLTSRRWPVHARSLPYISGDRMIVFAGDALNRGGLNRWKVHHLSHNEQEGDEPYVDESGFNPSQPALSNLHAWLDFLNDTANLPEWAVGPRVARVFRSSDAAASQGFSAVPLIRLGSARHSSHPCVVIEQGLVQIWGFFYRPHDTTQYLPEEAYEALHNADVFPTELAQRDERAGRAWARFVSAFFRVPDGLPDAIDVSEDGEGVLQHIPAEPIEYVNI